MFYLVTEMQMPEGRERPARARGISEVVPLSAATLEEALVEAAAHPLAGRPRTKLTVAESRQELDTSSLETSREAAAKAQRRAQYLKLKEEFKNE